MTGLPLNVRLPLAHLDLMRQSGVEPPSLILISPSVGPCALYAWVWERASDTSGRTGYFNYANWIELPAGLNKRLARAMPGRRLPAKVPEVNPASLLNFFLRGATAISAYLTELSALAGTTFVDAIPVVHVEQSGEQMVSLYRGFLFTRSAIDESARAAFLWRLCSNLFLLLQPNAAKHPLEGLRPNELECIKWAVAGKTLDDIAKITGFNYRTVRFYIDSARERYGYATNTQLYVRVALDFNLEPLGALQANGCPLTELRSG